MRPIYKFFTNLLLQIDAKDDMETDNEGNVKYSVCKTCSNEMQFYIIKPDDENQHIEHGK